MQVNGTVWNFCFLILSVLNIKITAKFLQLSFKHVGVYLFCHSLPSHTCKNIECKLKHHPCLWTTSLQLSYSQLTFQIFVSVADSSPMLIPSWLLAAQTTGSILKASAGSCEVYSFPAVRQLVKGRWPVQARETPPWHSLVNRPPNSKFPE